jgi:excisionase family DNA binding protein
MALTVEQLPMARPCQEDAKAITELDRTLESALEAQAQEPHEASAHLPALVGPDGSQVPIPLAVSELLHEIVHHLARGDSITLVPRPKELTTQQAAEVLNISRPFLIKLLDRGEIPYHREGTHRRITLEDVLAYRARRSAQRRKGIEQLAQRSQELGIY